MVRALAGVGVQMWKWLGGGLGVAWLALAGACTGPACVRNSQCESGLECRDSKCQTPLPPAPPEQPVAGYRGCRRGFYCWIGGTGTSPPPAGRAPVNTSTRYQDGGVSGTSPNDVSMGGSGGSAGSTTMMDAGVDAAMTGP